MNIHTKHWDGKELTETIEQHFSRVLDGDHEGLAENAAATAENAATALGRLVDILAQRGVLNAEDVIKVSKAYSGNGVRFSA